MVDWRWDKIERRRIQLCNQSTWCICSSASDIMDSLYPLFHILSTTLLVSCLPHSPPVFFDDNSKVRNAFACTLHPMSPGLSQSTVIGNGRGAVIDQLFCCIHTLCESLRSKSAVCKNKFNLSTESECMDGYHGIIDVPACNSQVRWRAVRVLKIEPFIYFRNEISKCFVSVFGLWLSDWLGYCGHGINSTRRILFSYFVWRPIIIVQLPPTRYSSAFWHNTLVSHSHSGWSNR